MAAARPAGFPGARIPLWPPPPAGIAYAYMSAAACTVRMYFLLGTTVSGPHGELSRETTACYNRAQELAPSGRMLRTPTSDVEPHASSPRLRQTHLKSMFGGAWARTAHHPPYDIDALAHTAVPRAWGCWTQRPQLYCSCPVPSRSA